MALLHISEPSIHPSSDRSQQTVGIDLGTTHSLVAWMDSEDNVELLKSTKGSYLVPSVVHYGNDRITVGDEAIAHMTYDPLNTIGSVKRLIGRSFCDLESMQRIIPYHLSQTKDSGSPCIKTRHGLITPVQISSEILKYLKIRTEHFLKRNIFGAVVTVPAYFDDAQRQATKDIAQLAGLNILRLLNEPTAAAIAYGLDKKQNHERCIAVYDLGGGTFDISILKLQNDIFKVLATGGDVALGGDDIDQEVTLWILQQAGIAPDAIATNEWYQLLMYARSAKEMLSTRDHVILNWKHWRGTLTRTVLQTLITPLVERTLVTFKRVLHDADINTVDLSEVIMVGGATRIPYIQQKLTHLTGKIPLVTIDPECVVAIGASIHAAALSGHRLKNELLLLDVTPLSLGLETMGGLMEKIIHRNATIPLTKAQEFTTHRDGQTSMSIHVLQGERELVTDNRTLARFILRNIPPMPAGMARIRVTFQIDADGLLSVSAEEKNSGAATSVEVKPSYGLSNHEIKEMLEAAYTMADTDKQQRALHELFFEAEQLITALKTALSKDGNHFLSKKEYQNLEQSIEQLEELLQQKNPEPLRASIESLGRLSEAFAQKRMNASITQMIKGRSIDELKGKLG